MAATRTLKLNILAETASLLKGLKDADKATRTAGDRIKAGFKVAAAAIAAAGAAAIAFGVKAIKAAEAAATANARIAQINESMGLFGSSVGEVNERLVKYAEATARATGIDQNSIKATQAKLLTFRELAQSANEVGGEFDRATKAAIDLAAAGFGSAEENAVQLGKALQDPIKGLTALSRSGVTFNETEKERIKTLVESNQVGEAQKLILQAIEQQVGGTAEATANASERIKVTFNLLTEQVGMVLLPVFEKFANFLIDKVVPFIQNFLVPTVQRLTDSFNKNAAPALGKIFDIVKKDLLPILEIWWRFLTRDLIPTLQAALKPVLDIIVTGLQFLLQKVKDNKEGFEAFIGVVKGVWEFIKQYLVPLFQGALLTAINLVFRAIGFLIDAFSAVFKIIQTVAKFLGQDLSYSLDIANKATNNLNTGTVDAYKSFAEQSRTIKEDVLPATNLLTAGTDALTESNKGLTASSKQVTAALKEQFNAKQSLDLIRSGFGSAVGVSGGFGLPGGESIRSAAELVGQFGGFVPGFNQLPTDPFFGFGRGSDIGSFKQGSGVVNINVNGTVIDPEGAARAIEQLLADSNARGGALFSDVFGINP
jgi:phage-related protein